MFVEDVIAFGFSASDVDEAFFHGLQGVHGWSIAVELVEYAMAAVHELLVLVEGQVLGLDDFALGGIGLADGFECLEHDVGALVLCASGVDAYEEADGVALIGGDGGGVLGNNGQWQEAGLLGKVVGVACIVFVETGGDAVAVAVDILAVGAFGCADPFFDVFLHGCFVESLSVANVEVSVAELSEVEAGIYPVPVGSEGSGEHFPVVAFQVVEEVVLPLGLEFEAVGVDELHDIESAHLGQEGDELGGVAEFVAERVAVATEVDVAFVVAPAGSVGDDENVVSEGSESFGKGGVEIAVFSEKQDFHIVGRERCSLNNEC